MPSGHIYSRVGRYHEATIANVNAIELDRQYFAMCNVSPEAYYRQLYFTHKHAFLVFSSMMEGRMELSQQSIEQLKGECNLGMVASQLGGSFIGYTASQYL